MLILALLLYFNSLKIKPEHCPLGLVCLANFQHYRALRRVLTSAYSLLKFARYEKSKNLLQRKAERSPLAKETLRNL
jgi:hypothetical protein